MGWQFGISRCKLLYIGWINKKVLLYSTVNYVQYPVKIIMEKNMKKYIYLNHFAVHQKITQHCKSTILQQQQQKKNVIIHTHTVRDCKPHGCIFHCENLKGRIIMLLTI